MGWFSKYRYSGRFRESLRKGWTNNASKQEDIRQMNFKIVTAYIVAG
jgi:hypothetical protein